MKLGLQRTSLVPTKLNYFYVHFGTACVQVIGSPGVLYQVAWLSGLQLLVMKVLRRVHLEYFIWYEHAGWVNTILQYFLTSFHCLKHRGLHFVPNLLRVSHIVFRIWTLLSLIGTFSDRDFWRILIFWNFSEIWEFSENSETSGTFLVKLPWNLVLGSYTLLLTLKGV